MLTRETPRPTSRVSRPLLVGVAVGVTLAVMLLVALLGLVGRPGYTSSAQVYVSGSSTGQPAAAVSPRVASFAALAQSRQLANRVDRRLDLAGSPADLQGHIHAEAVPGTMLLRIDVTASRASAARRTATGVLAELDRLGRTISGARSGSASTLRTVTGPSTPSERDGRHLTRDVLRIGLPVGIVAGLLVALVLARRPRPLRTRDDVAASIAAPVLGEITIDPQGTASNTSGAAVGGDVEGLRDNLRFLSVDSPGPLVVVAGPADQRDVLEAAIGLASSIARTGSPVLLVDADLRSASLAPRLGLSNEPGLSSVLAGDVTLADAVQVAPQDGLHVLSAGRTPPNPGDLIASATLRRVLTSAREEHRTVIVVVAAAGPPGEVARLVAATDGALLVVRPGSLDSRDLRTVARGLSARGGALLGTVLVGSAGDQAEAPSTTPVEAGASVTTRATGAPGTEPAGGPAPSATSAPDVPDGDTVVDKDGQDEQDEGDEEPYVPSFFTDPEPWTETGPVDLDPDDRDRVDPWVIRETPDNPEPFWVATEPEPAPAEETRSLSVAEMEAEVVARALDETPPPPVSDPDPAGSRVSDTDTDTDTDADADTDTDAAQSPWLSRDGEEWTPPVPVDDDPEPPAAPWVAAEPQPLDGPRPWAGHAETTPDDAPEVESRAAGAEDPDPAGAPVEPIEPDESAVAVSTSDAPRSSTGPTIADRVAETLRALRKDASLGEPPRRGPLTAGELAVLSGLDEPDEPDEGNGGADAPGQDPSAAPSEAHDRTPGDRNATGALDEALADDEPWSGPTAAPGSSTSASDPLTDELEPGADDEPTPTFRQTTGSPPAPRSTDPADTDEPRTGSLLDEFLTEDADEPDPEPDQGPDPVPTEKRRDDRGSLWHPSRWLDG